jgi:hypothetical protein
LNTSTCQKPNFGHLPKWPFSDIVADLPIFAKQFCKYLPDLLTLAKGHLEKNGNDQKPKMSELARLADIHQAVWQVLTRFANMWQAVWQLLARLADIGQRPSREKNSTQKVTE